MKKPMRVIFLAACLAGIIGQVAAFGATTNSTWSVTSISLFSAGKIKVLETNAATAVFLSDGTASLLIGTNQFAGTYTNNTKQVTLTLGAGGVAALKTNALDLIQAQVPSATLTVKSVKFSSKIKLSKTGGIPVSATDTVSGKGCETIGGKVKCKSFKLKTLWTNWVLTSGDHF